VFCYVLHLAREMTGEIKNKNLNEGSETIEVKTGVVLEEDCTGSDCDRKIHSGVGLKGKEARLPFQGEEESSKRLYNPHLESRKGPATRA